MGFYILHTPVPILFTRLRLYARRHVGTVKNAISPHQSLKKVMHCAEDPVHRLEPYLGGIIVAVGFVQFPLPFFDVLDDILNRSSRK